MFFAKCPAPSFSLKEVIPVLPISFPLQGPKALQSLLFRLDSPEH